MRSLSLLVALACYLTICAAGFAQTPTIGDALKNHAEYRKLLNIQVDTMAFQQPMSLKQALELLLENLAKSSKDPTVFVNRQAFRDRDPDFDVYEVKVKLGPLPARQSAGELLGAILSHVPGGASFLIQSAWFGGFIEITSPRDARSKTWQLVGQLVVPWNRNAFFDSSSGIGGRSKPGPDR